MGVSGNVSSVLIHVSVSLTGNTELSHIDVIRRDVCCEGTLRVILRRKETFNLFKLSVLGRNLQLPGDIIDAILMLPATKAMWSSCTAVVLRQRLKCHRKDDF